MVEYALVITLRIKKNPSSIKFNAAHQGIQRQHKLSFSERYNGDYANNTEDPFARFLLIADTRTAANAIIRFADRRADFRIG